MSLDDLYKKITDKFDTKLQRTTPVSDLPDELKNFLNKLYNEKAWSTRLFATLLNGIFTEQLETFLMSKNLMMSLVAADHQNKNLDRATLNNTEYMAFVALLRKREIIVVNEESEEISSEYPKGLAGTWTLVDRDAKKLLDRNGPQELDEEGHPYIDDDEAIQQYENSHKNHHVHLYHQWLDQQIAHEEKLEGSDTLFSQITSRKDELPENNCKIVSIPKKPKFY